MNLNLNAYCELDFDEKDWMKTGIDFTHAVYYGTKSEFLHDLQVPLFSKTKDPLNSDDKHLPSY